MIGVSLKFPKAVARQIIESVLDSIQPDWRPTTLEPLGCGFYGCVYPTPAPDVVLKLTTDPSEAAFVTAAMRIHGDRFPPGIVHYYRIDATTSSHDGRGAYLIWREAADHVGTWLSVLNDTYGATSVAEGRSYLRVFYDGGATLRELLEASGNPAQLQRNAAGLYGWARDHTTWKNVRDGDLVDHQAPERFAATIHAMGEMTQKMSKLRPFSGLGETLGLYMKHALLVTDVGSQNLGIAAMRSGVDLVITDPGEVVSIQPFLDALR